MPLVPLRCSVFPLLPLSSGAHQESIFFSFSLFSLRFAFHCLVASLLLTPFPFSRLSLRGPNTICPKRRESREKGGQEEREANTEAEALADRREFIVGLYCQGLGGQGASLVSCVMPLVPS